MTQTFFVTGTDTDAGKTLVSAALLTLAAGKKLHTLGLKPLAAGGLQTERGLCNEDALLLQQVATLALDYQQVNPVILAEAMAPHIAAMHEGKRLSVAQLVGYTRGALMSRPGGVKPDFCVIEGAGGWRVPLTSTQTTADLAKELKCPVILVVGMKLGCLNHALLTAEAIIRDGVKIAGWVASQVDPKMDAVEENLDTLKHLLSFPHLGFVPWLKNATPEAAAEHLSIEPLQL